MQKTMARKWGRRFIKIKNKNIKLFLLINITSVYVEKSQEQTKKNEETSKMLWQTCRFCHWTTKKSIIFLHISNQQLNFKLKSQHDLHSSRIKGKKLMYI
jgi:hypothetical protein